MLTSVFGNMGEDLVHRSAEEVDVVDEEPRLNVVGETPAVLDAVAVDPSKEFAMEDHIPNTSAGGYMD
ncbi:hypothetical protein PHLCEN_2v5287 [Hermanssonia centrifuga]|uniref:Uncharacterized protein n=1 Tax=Hermanssonia centrifuga TaxID=98765 RepID=A0A2R6P8L8_9APHY|nr:hypothetical protein PHLCEN_2v5287 [Hermanssonia centrifuga]